MTERLVSFTVDYPQLENPAKEPGFGKKKAGIWKNLESTSLIIGALCHYDSPLRNFRPFESPIRSNLNSSTEKMPPKSNETSFFQHFYKSPKFTKAHPKIITSSPIVENLSPNKRMGDIAINILKNRRSLG